MFIDLSVEPIDSNFSSRSPLNRHNTLESTFTLYSTRSAIADRRGARDHVLIWVRAPAPAPALSTSENVLGLAALVDAATKSRRTLGVQRRH